MIESLKIYLKIKYQGHKGGKETNKRRIALLAGIGIVLTILITGAASGKEATNAPKGGEKASINNQLDYKGLLETQASAGFGLTRAAENFKNRFSRIPDIARKHIENKIDIQFPGGGNHGEGNGGGNGGGIDT